MTTDSLNVKAIMDELNKIPTEPSLSRVSSKDYHMLRDEQHKVRFGRFRLI